MHVAYILTGYAKGLGIVRKGVSQMIFMLKDRSFGRRN